MTNLMITGYSGFVGTNFIGTAKEYRIQKVDLRETTADKVDYKKVDCVLHFAALAHKKKSMPEKKHFEVNSDLAYETAANAKLRGVKQFILMSSVKVYGESTTGLPPWNEKSPCAPLGFYGKSKFDAENRIRKLGDDNFIVSIIRSCAVYGPGVKGNILRLIKLVDKIPLLPLGKIRNKRSMIYVGNLIALIEQIINKKKSGIFLAADDRSLSTTELIKLIGDGMHRESKLIALPRIIISLMLKIRNNFTDKLWGSLEVDNKYTLETLDFKPPFSIETGVKKMIEWYRGTIRAQ